MSFRSALLFFLVIFSVTISAQNLTIFRSEKGVNETTQMIVQIIKDNSDLIFFETVSHDEIASSRGLDLSPTRSILFEDPELTTALIECQQTAALDLPLEILVWEENADVYIGYIDPKFMVKRFMIQDCDETIDKLTRLMVRVTMDAMRQL